MASKMRVRNQSPQNLLAMKIQVIVHTSFSMNQIENFLRVMLIHFLCYI